MKLLIFGFITAITFLAVTSSCVTPPPGSQGTNLVAYFDRSQCPTGWIEAQDLQGRLILGTNKGELVSKIVGKALPFKNGLYQYVSHSHYYKNLEYSPPGKSSDTFTPKHGADFDHYGQHKTYSTNGTTGSASTKFPFIQFIVCEYTDQDNTWMEDLPIDTYAFFNRTKCPKHWKLANTVEGRFFKGITASEKIGDTVGNPWKDENGNLVSTHTHNIKYSYKRSSSKNLETDTKYDHTKLIDPDKDGEIKGSTDAKDNGVPYEALLVCMKTVGKPFGGLNIPQDMIVFLGLQNCPAPPVSNYWVTTPGTSGSFFIGMPENSPDTSLGANSTAGSANIAHQHSVSPVYDLDNVHVYLPALTGSEDYANSGHIHPNGNTDSDGLVIPYFTISACTFQGSS